MGMRCRRLSAGTIQLQPLHDHAIRCITDLRDMPGIAVGQPVMGARLGAATHVSRGSICALPVEHVSEAESTSGAPVQLGDGWRQSICARTSPSSCRNRAASTWAAHMPSGPRVGPRASRMLCARAVQEAERRYR